MYILIGHSIWLLWENPSKTAADYYPVLAAIRIHLYNTFTYATTAAFMFFAISGFFIHLRSARQIALTNSFAFDTKAFFRSRCQRMLPPYYFALLVTAAIDSLGRFWHPSLYYARTTDAFLNFQFSSMQFSLSSVIPAVLLVPGSLGVSFGTNAVLWFFSFQIIYYLVYPLWLRLRKSGALPAYASAPVIAAVGCFLPSDWFIRPLMITYPFWLAGAAIAEIACKNILRPWHAGIGFCVAALGFLGVRALPTTFFVDPVQTLFHGVCSAGLVIAAVAFPVDINKYKMLQVVETAGRESYTIFLCHFPLLVFIAAWVFEVYKKRTPGMLLFVLVSGLTVYVCHLGFRLCERHFQHRRLSG